jgi:hypothetical protein
VRNVPPELTEIDVYFGGFILHIHLMNCKKIFEFSGKKKIFFTCLFMKGMKKKKPRENFETNKRLFPEFPLAAMFL